MHPLVVFTRRWSFAATVVAAAAAALLAAGVSTPARAQAVITVDTTSDVVDVGGGQTAADLPGPDGQTSLREATIAATNTDGPDTVTFDIPTSDPGFDGTGFAIVVEPSSDAEELRLGDDGTTLDATTQPGGHPITVQGSVQARADERTGLRIVSSGNTVKGLGWRLYGTAIRVTGNDNLISGVTVRDGHNGIQFSVSGEAATGGNALLGSTITGNDRTPVFVSGNAGGTVSGNTITDNDGTGVAIWDSDGLSISDNVISGNLLGIHLTSVGDGTYGSISGNTVTGNTGDGVQIDTAGFTISGNTIGGNGELGINLRGGREDAYGVTRNGSSTVPDHPEHIRAAGTAGATVIDGRITRYSTPASVRIELFATEAPDPSGHGEGETYLGTVTADARGRFTATLPGGLAGQYLTTTATRPDGTTTEFSAAVLIEPPNGGNKT